MLRLYKRADSPFWYAAGVTKDGRTVKYSTGVACSASLRKAAFTAAEIKLVNLDLRVASCRISDAWVHFKVRNTRVAASSKEVYEDKVARVIHAAGDLSLTDINVAYLRNFVATRRAQGANDRAIRMDLDALSSVINFAIESGLDGAPETNPVRAFPKRMLERRASKRYARDPADVRKLIEAAAQVPVWKELLPVIALTGMRRNEAFGLLWEEVDLGARIINLSAHRTKARRGRTIPMLDTVYTVISTARKYPGCPWVFPNPNTMKPYATPYDSWYKVARLAGVEKMRIHDLRHSFATLARALGLPKEDRMDIMGHVSPDIHDGYARSTAETLWKSLKKTDMDTVLLQREKSI